MCMHVRHTYDTLIYRLYEVKKRCWSKADHADGELDCDIEGNRQSCSYWCAPDGCNDQTQFIVDELTTNGSTYHCQLACMSLRR